SPGACSSTTRSSRGSASRPRASSSSRPPRASAGARLGDARPWTKSFPCSRAFAWARGSPPARVRERALEVVARLHEGAAALLRVVVEALAGLLAEEPGLHALGDLEAGRVARVAVLVVEALEDRVHDVEADEVGERERAHRVVAAPLQALVDALRVRDALLE